MVSTFLAPQHSIKTESVKEEDIKAIPVFGPPSPPPASNYIVDDDQDQKNRRGREISFALCTMLKTDSDVSANQQLLLNLHIFYIYIYNGYYGRCSILFSRQQLIAVI